MLARSAGGSGASPSDLTNATALPQRPQEQLASIPGQLIELRFPWWWSSWWEPEPQGAPVPPGDGDFEAGEAGVDEDGVVAAQVQRAGDGVAGDVQGAGGVQEVPPDLVRGGIFVSGELEREKA